MKTFTKFILYFLSCGPFAWTVTLALLMHFMGDGWYLISFLVYSLYGYVFCLLFIWTPLIAILASRKIISAKVALINLALLITGIVVACFFAIHAADFKQKPETPNGVYLRY